MQQGLEYAPDIVPTTELPPVFPIERIAVFVRAIVPPGIEDNFIARQIVHGLKLKSDSDDSVIKSITWGSSILTRYVFLSNFLADKRKIRNKHFSIRDGFWALFTRDMQANTTTGRWPASALTQLVRRWFTMHHKGGLRAARFRHMRLRSYSAVQAA
jgi:hypothetical protein